MASCARGVVVFAHGSGSRRLSPRNRLVARRLQDHGFGTLLFDPLTAQEEADAARRSTQRTRIRRPTRARRADEPSA